ncbi:hypothetical protein [Kaistella carnis]|uniref:Uncharacterized protein n=1 Tax=Kaistella carnis TaxID=1241979 RepID=A0A3G8XLC8_9FLAO|nr:hypothetical protein [Kaistella carnis]AZI33648.1 hypothetical protein EIB73_10830 [Kaistella carnis]
MAKTKVLITVTTYPLPSRSYDELVCTAGVLEDGTWIRIYPVPFKFLQGFKDGQKLSSFKYHWVEMDLVKREDDFRPESHSPSDYDFSKVLSIGKVNTKNNWQERKHYCLKNVYTNKGKLIEDSKAPNNISLVTFKPSKITSFEIVDDEREWKEVWKELRKQGDLFDQDKETEIQIRKLPYKFYYNFLDDEGVSSRLMIEDWEIGALYWNCLKASEGNEILALQKVRERYESQFINHNDIYLFLGTTKEWHLRRGKNPFVIIGVFYPLIQKEEQLSLFF